VVVGTSTPTTLVVTTHKHANVHAYTLKGAYIRTHMKPASEAQRDDAGAGDGIEQEHAYNTRWQNSHTHTHIRNKTQLRRDHARGSPQHSSSVYTFTHTYTHRAIQNSAQQGSSAQTHISYLHVEREAQGMRRSGTGR
jgi:hypothetical protein